MIRNFTKLLLILALFFQSTSSLFCDDTGKAPAKAPANGSSAVVATGSTSSSSSDKKFTHEEMLKIVVGQGRRFINILTYRILRVFDESVSISTIKHALSVTIPESYEDIEHSSGTQMYETDMEGKLLVIFDNLKYLLSDDDKKVLGLEQNKSAPVKFSDLVLTNERIMNRLEISKQEKTYSQLFNDWVEENKVGITVYSVMGTILVGAAINTHLKHPQQTKEMIELGKSVFEALWFSGSSLLNAMKTPVLKVANYFISLSYDQNARKKLAISALVLASAALMKDSLYGKSSSGLSQFIHDLNNNLRMGSGSTVQFLLTGPLLAELFSRFSSSLDGNPFAKVPNIQDVKDVNSQNVQKALVWTILVAGLSSKSLKQSYDALNASNADIFNETTSVIGTAIETFGAAALANSLTNWIFE